MIMVPINKPILKGIILSKGKVYILVKILSKSSYSPKDIKMAVPLIPGIIVVIASIKPIK